jgi:hypothetical protein
MKPEEASKDIVEDGIELGAGDFVDIEALKVAAKALEKQVAKKPVLFNGKHEKCPACGSFGIAEYCIQGLIILITVLAVRRFKLSYLFSFVTALLYGALLDSAIFAVSFIPNEALILRIVWF